MKLRCTAEFKVSILLSIFTSLVLGLQDQASGSERSSQVRIANVLGVKPLDFSELGLSEEQKQKIEEMRKANSSKSRELRAKFRELANQMSNLMFSSNSTDVEIRVKALKLRKILQQLEDTQLNDFLNVRTVLTPGQKQKLQQLNPQKN